ncbi:MAG TPA: 2-succinyl-6-hydroxy-2,4-cyclohexadiene-1-carboxylate synthase [Gemmatimonadales bacterium]
MLIRLRDGLRLHVRDRGRGVPVVALHGFAGPSDAWDAAVAGLSATRRVVAIDLLGHGASDAAAVPDRYAMDNAIADVLDVMDALDLDRAAVVGYSMGGRVALAAACHAPGRIHALVLESASPGLPSDDERRDRRAADERLAADIGARGTEWFADHWSDLPLFETRQRLGPEVLAAVRRRLLANRPGCLAACLRGLGAGAQPPLWDALTRLTVPTLLLAGADDTRFVEIANRMHGLLPAAQVSVIEDAGHTVHLEQPAQWQRGVGTFLERHLPTR